MRLARGESRLNIVTSGVPLNHLLDREFWMGEVLMRSWLGWRRRELLWGTNYGSFGKQLKL